MTQLPARTRAAQAETAAIAANVQTIEKAKRPTALAMMASRLNISEGMLANTLKKTVFNGCRNDEEFAALIVVANEYGLNPLTKEIYAFPAKGGGVVPMIGVDGWIKIVNNHPQIDGFEWNDLPDADGKLYACECVIRRKDRSGPIKVTEYLDECKRNTDPWNKSPARMLRHRAFMQCARYAFGFSGLYSEDEAEIIGDVQMVGEPVPARNVTPSQKQIPHDPETGEITEEAALEADRAAYRQMDGEQESTPAPSESAGPSGQEASADGADEPRTSEPPYMAKVREWTAALKGADAAMIKAVDNEFGLHRAALPEAVVQGMDAAILAARKDLKS